VIQAACAIQPLGAATPIDSHVERRRLLGELSAGRIPSPRWTYAPRPHDALRRALAAAERVLAADAESAVDALMLERVRELLLEAALCAAVGSSAVRELSAQRFAPAEAALVADASQLCGKWLAAGPSRAPPGPTLLSDDPHPASLLSRMRDAVGRSRLPFVVVRAPDLAPLAATGDRTIFVATGRATCEEDAIRTVLHEIEGHAWPRARSRDANAALFRAGTAQGVDDQEGRALLIEEREGFLSLRRRRQIAARHRAVEWMLAGASFGEVAQGLVTRHGLEVAEAVVAAERVFRGSDGLRPGLGRERVYIEAFLRVKGHLARHPQDERVLAFGQVSVGAAPTLRAFVSESAIADARAR
jgi:hypothetical protein